MSGSFLQAYLCGTAGLNIVDRLAGTGRLVVLRGGPEDNSIRLDRTNGMLSVVETSEIEVVKAPNFGGWS